MIIKVDSHKIHNSTSQLRQSLEMKEGRRMCGMCNQVSGDDKVVFTTSQQTKNICITFVQCRPNVFDVGPTLNKCYTNVL